MFFGDFSSMSSIVSNLSLFALLRNAKTLFAVEKMSGEQGPNCGKTIHGSSTNASAHASHLNRDVCTKIKISVLPQPLYSPDLAIVLHFFSSSNTKIRIKGRRLNTIKTGKFTGKFTRDIEKRVPRLLPEVETVVENCINQGEYFEGDRAVKL